MNQLPTAAGSGWSSLPSPHPWRGAPSRLSARKKSTGNPFNQGHARPTKVGIDEMTRKELQKYNRLTKRIVRRLPVTAAETMWVWRMRPAYLAMWAKKTAAPMPQSAES